MPEPQQYMNKNTQTPKPLVVWGVVLSRKNSQRLPGKAMLQLGGKPLAAWYLEAFSEATQLNQRFLFSDDEVLNAYCTQEFAGTIRLPDFQRPQGISHDGSSSFETLRWFLQQWPESHWPDAVMLGQLTTPFTKTDDVNQAIATYRKQHQLGTPCCVVSVTQPLKPARWLMYQDSITGLLHPLVQPTSNTLVHPNGALYILPTQRLMQHTTNSLSDFWGITPYEMPWVRSVDIDTPEDLAIAQGILHLANQATENTSTALVATKHTANTTLTTRLQHGR